MTEIDFYTNPKDPVTVACRLVAKARAQGHTVVIAAPDPETASAIDLRLWVSPATGFLPHCRDASALSRRTPVVIAATPDGIAHSDVLINLGTDVPSGFGRFKRLLEVVGTLPPEVQAARQRYRQYRDQGYLLRTTDLSVQPAPVQSHN